MKKWCEQCVNEWWKYLFFTHMNAQHLILQWLISDDASLVSLSVLQDINKRLSLPADIRLPEGYLEKFAMNSPPFDKPMSRRLRRASLVSNHCVCAHLCRFIFEQAAGSNFFCQLLMVAFCADLRVQLGLWDIIRTFKLLCVRFKHYIIWRGHTCANKSLFKHTWAYAVQPTMTQ